MLHSDPSISMDRENLLQLGGRERIKYFMDWCNMRRLNSGGTYFIPILKHFLSSCSGLTQPSVLSMSEWFPAKHWEQHLSREVCWLIHPPLQRNLCVQCHVFLSRNCLGVFYRCKGLFRGDLTRHLRRSQASMMAYVFRGEMNNRDNLLSRAVRPKHVHQVDKGLPLDSFKALLHPFLNSLQELSMYFRRTSW